MRLCLLLVVLVWPGLALGNEAMQKLQQSLSAIHSLTGQFEQRIIDEEGLLLEQSRGEFRLLQPDAFRWHILQPDEQLLVADNGVLWHYDVELETVSRRPMTLSAQSPLAILAGAPALLARHYRVATRESDDGDNAWWLYPLFEDADFVRLGLVFSAGSPVSLELLDPLARTTVIDFQALVLNPPLQAEAFAFELPAGVDFHDYQ